ncbi:MAG: DUF4439 domain-containing protein [Actinobacteria bacterium]|nr:DUF4439 domain-containing protein [Actinomycetota bacterium]MTB27969.1 DUF4439 domain-containing protein [Actinomycetota bacterium]
MVSMILVLFALSACSDTQPTSTTSTMPATALTQAGPALTQAIQGIDAAIYGYGVIGAHVSRSGQKKVKQAIATLNRQRLSFELALGAQVNEVPVAYELPIPITNTSTAINVAELLEMKLIPLFDDVVKSSTGITKSTAETASAKAAHRAASWNPTPVTISTPATP